MRRFSLPVLVAASALFPAAAAYALDNVDPYICPTALHGTGTDCFFEAVPQTYTMCRQVKSIEIIEFGHAQAQEGVNGAKSEYCVDKQKINITRPYQAALREATPWKDAIDHLRELQAYWLDSMVNLKWRTGEPPQDYEDRVNKVYDALSWKVDEVRVSFTTAPDAAGSTRMAAPKAKPAAKPKPAATAKAN